MAINEHKDDAKDEKRKAKEPVQRQDDKKEASQNEKSSLGKTIQRHRKLPVQLVNVVREKVQNSTEGNGVKEGQRASDQLGEGGPVEGVGRSDGDSSVSAAHQKGRKNNDKKKDQVDGLVVVEVGVGED